MGFAATVDAVLSASFLPWLTIGIYNAPAHLKREYQQNEDDEEFFHRPRIVIALDMVRNPNNGASHNRFPIVKYTVVVGSYYR